MIPAVGQVYAGDVVPPSTAPGGGGGEGAPSSWYLDGSMELRYVFQYNEDYTDYDLEELLSLYFGKGRDGWISGYVSGRMTHDLDGFDKPDDFLSISDTHGRFYGRLTAAYLDLRPDWDFLEAARVGRQWIPQVPEIVRMDGILLRSRRLEDTLRTRTVLFAGVPEHFEESSQRNDRVFGAGLEFQPFDRTRLETFYTRLKDVYTSTYVHQESRVSTGDDLFSFQVRQLLFDDRLNLFGSYSNLNNRSRDGRLQLAFDDDEKGIGVDVNYRILFSTQNALSTELDPYYSVLRSYHPYRELGVNLRKEITDTLSARGGATFRRLEQEGDKGPFNHDFSRYYAGADLERFPFKASTLSVTGDLFRAEGDRFWEVEGLWRHACSEKLDAEVGTGYALYHEDRYTLTERNHVRSVFARAEYTLVKDVTLRGGYVLEDDDELTTNRFEVSLRYRF